LSIYNCHDAQGREIE